MRGLNLKEIISKSNMNEQGLNIATHGQAYAGDIRVPPRVPVSGPAPCGGNYFCLSILGSFSPSPVLGSVSQVGRGCCSYPFVLFVLVSLYSVHSICKSVIPISASKTPEQG